MTLTARAGTQPGVGGFLWNGFLSCGESPKASKPFLLCPPSLNFIGISHSLLVSCDMSPRVRMEPPKRWKRR